MQFISEHFLTHVLDLWILRLAVFYRKGPVGNGAETTGGFETLMQTNELNTETGQV